jgi:hypothetical protein
MQLRIFKIIFKEGHENQQSLLRNIIENLEENETKYNQYLSLHNKDIKVSTTDIVDKKGHSIKEAKASFTDYVKGCSNPKRLGSLIKFKYYTDELGDGMDYRFTDYHKRKSHSKIPPSFLETFFLYASSKDDGIIFAPCIRHRKVNALLNKDLKATLKIKSFSEVKFDDTLFEKVLNKILTKEPSNIMDELNYVGAYIKDENLGKCYISIRTDDIVSYLSYKAFIKKYTDFKLNRIVFTTKLSELEDENNITKKIKVELSSSYKCPLKLGLRMAHLWYEQLFSWIGDIILEVA